MTILCFGTIRNNTALKHTRRTSDDSIGFGTIRNNTALKQVKLDRNDKKVLEPFETTQL